MEAFPLSMGEKHQRWWHRTQLRQLRGVRRGTAPPDQPGDINRAKYRQAAAVEVCRRNDGWLDPGERLLFTKIADEVRNRPVLDLGVGGGRTAWLLRLLTEDYVGIDLSPEMVEVCQTDLPCLRFEQGDAKDLSRFDDDQFKLVLFSFNGIDCLDHEDRHRTLREIRRVLQPDGLFVFSTLSLNGPLYGLAPWQWHTRGTDHLVQRLARSLFLFPTSLPRYARTYKNWWRNRKYMEHHDSWAIGPPPGLEFGVVLHWTLPSTQRDELAAKGFTVCELTAQNGLAISSDADSKSTWVLLRCCPQDTTPDERAENRSPMNSLAAVAA
jgi:SAM-dependent methyltransferase